jgi:AcrR family transcriptional regulator
MSTPTPRPDRTRRAVLDAAAERLSKDARASLSEVAAAAGVGRTTLHRCFATRDDLLHALADEALDTVAAAIDSARPGDDDAATALRRVVEQLVELGPYLRFLNADPVIYDSPTLGRRWYDVFEPVATAVRRGQDSGQLRADLPVDWIVDLLGGAVITAWDSVHEGRLAARHAPGLVATSLLAGVTAPPARRGRSQS